MYNNFKGRLIIGLTAKKGENWEGKLREINKLGVKRIALFTEEISRKNRIKLYSKLIDSCIKEIPLAHIRKDTETKELVFLIKNFKTKYFNIHESSFKYLGKWKRFHKKLYLEMNYDNKVPKDVVVKKIGGFCIDLSHFKASEEKFTEDFKYVMKRKNIHKYFKCNHLNGYSYKKNCDVHRVNSIKDFDYLKTLPKFLFGNVIALEMYNSVKEQLKYKKYLTKLLNKRFN